MSRASRPYAPPAGGDTELRRFAEAQAEVLALTRPGDPDWRVLPKWQRFHGQITEDERRELLRIGRLARSLGWYDPPEELWRVIRVTDVPTRWGDLSTLPRPRLARGAAGLRSWSRNPDGLDEVFGGGAVTVKYHWPSPIDGAVKIDGDALEEGLAEGRPALHLALRRASSRGTSLDDRAGFDHEECIVRPPPFRVEGWTTDRFDDDVWHSVTLAAR